MKLHEWISWGIKCGSQLSQQTILKSKCGIRRFKSEIWVASGGSPFFSNGHPEVQVLEWFFGSEKNDHKKLAIRKKSTILGFLPSNFNTQLAMPVRFQEKKLVEIGCHLPPEIKVQTEMQLDGTIGMYVHGNILDSIEKNNHNLSISNSLCYLNWVPCLW